MAAKRYPVLLSLAEMEEARQAVVMWSSAFGRKPRPAQARADEALVKMIRFAKLDGARSKPNRGVRGNG